MSSKDTDEDQAPSVKALDEGYNQTYVIMTNSSSDEKASSSSAATDSNDVFFKCGNWCYKGLIQFGGLDLKIDEVPILIPLLQKQQGSLRYYCNANSVPSHSDYAKPLIFLDEANEFIAQELISDAVEKELRKMSSIFPWIDDQSSSTYFQLTLGDMPSYMNNVKIIASKTYTRGLIVISIYCDNMIYFVVNNCDGDQPLLDVRFPDVSEHGQGFCINTYNDHTQSYRQLTLWHVVTTGSSSKIVPTRTIPKIKTMSISSKNYQQTYCILKSSWDANSSQLAVHHDVLFRFGSWCYAGRVQLTPSLTLADIPYIIPALRMQQSRLDFFCDVSQVPINSPFADALQYVQQIEPVIEDHVVRSEDTLNSLIDRLHSMGLGESVRNWLEGDSNNSFFEFKTSPSDDYCTKFKNLELIVSKTYYASGIIVIMIIFQTTIYVSLLENAGESPLLDSRFPDVSGKGRGYQLESYSTGTEQWKELRKVSIWQTIGALEQEFRDKATFLAQSKVVVVDSTASAFDAKSQDLSSTVTHGGRSSCSGDDNNDDNHAAKTSLSSSSSSSLFVDINAKMTTIDPESDSMNLHSHSTNANNNTGSPSSSSSSMRSAKSKSSSPSTAADAKSSSITNDSTTIHSSSSSGSGSNIVSQPVVSSSSSSTRREAALPHHVPKIESLSNKMEELRKTMGSEGLKAPWDAKGRPLGAIGGGGGSSSSLGGRGLGLTPLGSIGGGKDAKK